MYKFEYFCIWDRNMVPNHFPIYSILSPIHGIADSLWKAVECYERAISELECVNYYPFDTLSNKVSPSKCIVIKHNFDKKSLKDVNTEELFMAQDDIDEYMSKVRYDIDVTNKRVERTISFRDRDDFTYWTSTLYNLSKENYAKLNSFTKGQIILNTYDKLLYRILDIDKPELFDDESMTTYYEPRLCVVKTDDARNVILSDEDLLGNNDKFKSKLWTSDIYAFEAIKSEDEKEII